MEFPTSLLSSPYFTLRETVHGGRSIFATTAIPINTLIHVSTSPHASVISNDFRKEVCAWCFAYNGRKGWKLTELDGGRERFCGMPCVEAWAEEEDGTRKRVAHAIGVARGRKRKATPCIFPDTSIAHPSDLPRISQDTLDAAWNGAALQQAGGNTQLDDMELSNARIAASALIRHHTFITSQALGSVIKDPIFALQANELPHTIERPDILPTHIRIYQFLREALSGLSDIKQYLDGSTFIRDVLSRDTGNSFGIWEQVPEDEGIGREMFGWGIWVDASFFNHNCAPNIKETRIGRALHFCTTRAIGEGEELCISYIDIVDDVEERQKSLKESWFFSCACDRCARENIAQPNGNKKDGVGGTVQVALQTHDPQSEP